MNYDFLTLTYPSKYHLYHYLYTSPPQQSYTREQRTEKMIESNIMITKYNECLSFSLFNINHYLLNKFYYQIFTGNHNMKTEKHF